MQRTDDVHTAQGQPRRGHDLPPRETVRGIVEACHARLGRPLSAADLEDVLQDVHVHAWRRLPSFRGDSSVETWVFGIARLSILSQMKRQDRRAWREVALAPELPDPVDPATRPGSRFDTEFLEALQRGLAAGGEHIGEIFEAHDVEGLPFAAIGERMGLTETAVKSRYYRSLEAIRTRLMPLWRSLRH